MTPAGQQPWARAEGGGDAPGGFGGFGGFGGYTPGGGGAADGVPPAGREPGGAGGDGSLSFLQAIQRHSPGAAAAEARGPGGCCAPLGVAAPSAPPPPGHAGSFGQGAGAGFGGGGELLPLTPQPSPLGAFAGSIDGQRGACGRTQSQQGGVSQCSAPVII